METLMKVSGAKETLKEKEHSFGKITAIITEICIRDHGEITLNMVKGNTGPPSELCILASTAWEHAKEMEVSFTLTDILGWDFGTMTFHWTWIEPFTQRCEMSLTLENALDHSQEPPLFMGRSSSDVWTATALKILKRGDMSAKIVLRPAINPTELRRKFGPADDLSAGVRVVPLAIPRLKVIILATAMAIIATGTTNKLITTTTNHTNPPS